MELSHRIGVQPLAPRKLTIDLEHKVVYYLLHVPNEFLPKLCLLFQDFVNDFLSDLNLLVDRKFSLFNAISNFLQSVFDLGAEFCNLGLGHSIVGFEVLNHFVLEVNLNPRLVYFWLNFLDDLLCH